MYIINILLFAHAPNRVTATAVGGARVEIVRYEAQAVGAGRRVPS